MQVKKDYDLSYLPDAISRGAELNVLPYFPSTLLDVVQNATIIAPGKGILFVDTEGNEELLTHVALLEDAGRILSGLRAEGIKPGDKVVLQVEDDKFFIAAFWGALLGGYIPVPLALPNSFPISESSEKVARVCRLLDHAYVVTDQSVEMYKDLEVIDIFPLRDLMGSVVDTDYHRPSPDDIAYIQFSSGSTGEPKGVVLTHRNLLTNIYAILRASANEHEHAIIDELFSSPVKEMDLPYSTCSWLPYSHDMGLIGLHLAPLTVGMFQIKMSTTTFVINPTLNILLIDKYRVTQMPSPNFGLLWMLYMVKDDAIKEVDLSCVEVLYNGAEPISPTAVRLFINRFSQYGFNPGAMFPAYGMAEASLLVSAPPIGKSTVYHLIDRQTFAKTHVAAQAREGEPVIEFVDEGYPALGMEIRIVDDHDQVVKEIVVGHIQIKGPNVTQGYYRNEAANAELFCGEWLRTGDLGFIKDGRLTVTGRHKDVIFVNGQNYYSHDIEEELQQTPEVGFKNMAICGVTDHDRGSERIVLFIKTKKAKESLYELLQKINEHLAKKICIGIDSIVPLPDIPRTTSGKVQRFVLRERYEAGEFKESEVTRLDRWVKDKGNEFMVSPPARTEPYLNLKGPDAISRGPELNILPYAPRTLLDLIQMSTILAPEHGMYSSKRGMLYVDVEGNETFQGYPRLLEEASQVLAGLRAMGLKQGDHVVIQIDDDRLFLAGFWGVALGGLIPVPLALPNSFPISEGSEKVANVCKLLDRPVIITDQPVDGYAGLEVRAVCPVKDLLASLPDTDYHIPDEDDIAYIQFSSGSTGSPKGVMLTHRNVFSNLFAILRAAVNESQQKLIDIGAGNPHQERDYPMRLCTWLPYTHDMGLIGFHFVPMSAGILQIKMSTTTFVINPTLNLLLIDKYRITQIPSPNFGLLWMMYTVKDEAIKGVDLSCVEVLFNGAEPISPTAVRLFIDRFSKYGFNPKAMFPVYGMAEAALMVTAPRVGEPSVYHALNRLTFAKKHVAVDAKDDEPSIEFVDEGYPIMGMEIRIVDDHERVVKETVVGHIQIKGPHVTKGYYRNEAANAELFCGEWLRTGDLGFIKNSRLTVTGRYKDVIFVNGQNYYSHDLEEELQLLPFVGFKNMAISGVTDHESETEKIVLFMKTRKSKEDLNDLLAKINEHLIKKIRVGIDSIVPMPDIPRTTSGKVQRFVLRERYEAGEFKESEVMRQDKWLKHKGEEFLFSSKSRYEQYIDLKGPEAISKGSALDLLPYFPQTLLELLQNASIFSPQRGVLYVDSNGNEDLQTYSMLVDEASRILAGLRAKGLKPGDHVVIQIDHDRRFLAGFWGSVLGGFIPVPLALPNSFPISEGSEKVANVCKLLDNAYILTDQNADVYKGLDVIAVISMHELMAFEPDRNYHHPTPEEIAYIQFSSGSTGNPKGVVLTHRNLVTNLFAILRAAANENEQRMIDEAFSVPPQPRDYPVRTCSWLPYTHDMGLIGFHMASMSAGMLQIKITTTTFIVNPTLNILLIDKYRITQIPSPNFGLLWMLYMVKDEAIKGADLSCIEVLFNGAEPISPTAVRLFCSRFSQYGFNSKAMFPVYGMAEASLLITAPPEGTQTVYRVIDRDAFTKMHVAIDPKGDDPSIEFVDEGYPAMGMEIRIVDDYDKIAKETVVGHIQIKGPNVTNGYYKNDEANRELFCGEWLRTGDLGFIKNGRLTVTGRYKDVIFVNGQNYYSHDIEEELQLLPFVGFKNMAICGVTDHEKGAEKIVLFMKSKRSKEELLDLLVKINEHLGKKIKVGIDAIVPLSDIPRTTSGKVQRFILRDRYAAGDFRDREVKRIEGIWGVGERYETIPEARTEVEPSHQRQINLRGLIEDLPLAMAEGDRTQFIPMFIKTLPEVLRIATILNPNGGILHVDEDGFECMQTYASLIQSAECVMGGLREGGLKPGDQVILQVEDSREFLSAFWGAVLGGFIPVPLPIPGGFPISEGMERITKVCQVLDRFCIITDQPTKRYRSLGEVTILDVRNLLVHAPDKHHHRPRPDDIAYLQFSSGSTGDPKGVILTHMNLLCTIDASARGMFDVRGPDIRPFTGFALHILKRRTSGKKREGLLSKAIARFSKTALAETLASNKFGKDILDTLLILGGVQVSSRLHMRFDDIKIVNWMPYSHDMGLIGFHLAPTLAGMDQIKLEPKTFVLKPALFLRLIDRYRASHVPSPNFGVQWLTTQVNEEEIKGIDLSCIKAFCNGSEPISPSITRAFIEKFKKYGFDPRAMYMAYGMAEASLQVTAPPIFTDPIFHRVDKDVFVREQIILPIKAEAGSLELTDVGYPVAGMKIRIVDDNDNLVHENVIGHIQIQGPHVVQGYFNNPEANRDLFCGKWLRTGDMGFMRGGRITITGRRKDIIIVNGQNLYAHDIEEHIKRVPGMAFREFAISGLRHFESDSEKVILFINTMESRAALASMLSRINDALIASIGIKIDFIVPVSEIPRTPSAKVKRYRLREQFEKGVFHQIVALDDAAAMLSSARDEQGHKLTEMECRIIDIWRAILGVDTIGKLDNFFDLGGNSLRATKVVSRIREEFNLEIPLRTIFEYQTIESFAYAIESLTTGGQAQFSPITPIDKKEYYAVSHAQRRLWLLDKVVPDSSFYNIAGAVLLEGVELNFDVLKMALQNLVDRHETMRTVFRTADSIPVQVIADSLELPMPIIDLSRKKNKDEQLSGIIEAEKLKPFNLETGPLFRITVVRLTKTKHAIVIAMHHIISDGWSMAILVQEAVGNYLAFIQGKPSPFPPFAVQYKDFAIWQNEILSSEAIKKQEAYWLDKLNGELPVLNLPTGRVRPAVQTQNGATLRMHIDKDLPTRLRDLARKEDVTQFMLMLAIFKFLLHKITGQDDIIVGSPIAGRNQAQIEPLIGFFVNVLPLRSDLSGNPTFKEFLDQVRQTALGAYANQDYPFDKLVEVVNPVRDLSRSPIFDVIFDFREASADPFANVHFGDMSLTDITGDDPNAKFDLFVTGNEGEDGITMKFEYNADLFEAATIARMLGYYQNLIQEVLAAPEKRLSEMEMLAPEDRSQVLVGFNQTVCPFPMDKCTHELFEEQAVLYPDKDALVFGEERLSYAELNARANKVARYLRGHGVGRGTYVAIMVERSFDMLIGVLGILKAGGAYVPIDADYPEARIQYMLFELQSPVAIVHETLLENLSGYAGHVMCLERFWKVADTIDTSNLENVNTPDDIAYVIYTSGSTGKPKGVMVPHIGIVRLVKNTNYAQITPEDRFLQVSTFAFDAATMEFWGSLANGGTLYLVSSSDAVNPDALADLLLKHEITILFITTVMFNQLVDNRPDGITKLKSLLTGGEMQSIAHMRKGFKYVQPGVLTHVYGPTENTTYSTYYQVYTLPEGMMSVPIGYPLANSSVYILDKYLKPVPIGVPGEIYVGGYGLAKGYLNDPMKTAKAFIENSIPDVAEKILYKTGDLGLWLPDGAVDILGRIDQQVKIRGHRIELGEIEAELRRHEKINDCVVVVKDLGGGNKFLVAYYVSDQEIPIDVLRASLKNELPDYMIPNFFLRLATLPLNKNGKVDRAALPEPEGLRPQMAIEYVPPSNDTEAAIVRIWEDILGIEQIGIRDNFFDLGGHSLKATQVLSRIKKDLGYEISLRKIFEDPTIEGICKAIYQEKGRGLSEIEPLPTANAYALSHAQKRLWFLDQMLPNSPAYNVPISLMIDGPIEPGLLEKTIQLIIDRHETLRTTFTSTDEGPVQHVAENLWVSLRAEDASDRDDKGLEALVTEEALTPFALAKGPLFRARLYRVSDQRHLFIFNMHHIISDGWSIEVLMKEIVFGYTALTEGKTLGLQPLRIQYRDYAAWQNKLLAEGALKDQEEYWLRTLGGELPVIDLPTDRHRPTMTTTNGSTMRFDLDPTLSLALKTKAKEQDVTLFMFLLGVLDILLCRLTGQNDIIVGSPIAGRNNPDLEHLIGFFVNTLALRANLGGNPDFIEVLKRIKETCLGAYANQDFPFDKLIDLLDLPRDTSRTPIFNIMFAMQDFSPLIRMAHMGKFTFRSVEGELKTTKFDMTVFAFDMGDYVSMRIEYNTDLFDADTITRFFTHYANLMREVIARPSEPISLYALMGKEERKKVLSEFNATEHPYPRESTLVELFEARVVQEGSHPAVVFADEMLSYDELNCRANMLAHCLRAYGVGPGVIVAMLIESPHETIVSILGIQKAGGAYMPIDPEWPAERIEFMLQDSRASVVISKAQHIAKIPEGMPVLCVDQDREKIQTYSAKNPQSAITAQDVAYAIYTSGSTGKPKGSLVLHRGVVNLVSGLEKILYAYYNGHLKVAQVASFTFDASVQQIFASLLLGHTLYPIPASMKRDMSQLIPYLLQHEIDVIDGTPSLWEMMVNSGIMDEPSLKLKHIIIGGEALPVDILRRYQAGAYGKATRWTNVYGVTESSVDSTYYLADLNALKGRTYVPIGAPIINTQIYILDKDLHPVAIGVPGEIYIGGNGLSKGYLNNPEKTAQNFISSPFKEGARLYKTGDLGKWLPDGNIEFIGRIDFQVKIHGFRIELGEIESVLGSYPRVSDCVVVDKQDEVGNKYLVAYYVAEEDIPVTELRAFLGRTLPDYMIPLRYMRLDALPLNTSGKVDRNALPEFEGVRPEMQTVFVEPRTELERVLVEVWMEVLKLDRVGIYDNFFDLGGDSIISLQVVNRLKRRGYLIKPRHMFEYQTIAEIVPVVERITVVEAEQGPVVGEAPLTPIQRYFFALKLANPNHYNQALLFQSKARIETIALKKSLQALIGHHDVLRACFKDGRQEMRPLPEEPYCVVKDIGSDTEVNAEIKLLQASLAIDKGPVFASGLYHAPESDYLLLIGHHLVVDGVSWRILLEDLFQGYGAALAGSEIKLPDKTTSYKEWADKLSDYARRGDVLTEALYWKDEVASVRASVPIDHDRGVNDMASADSVRVELDEEETAHLLKDAHRAYNTAVNDLLLTAFMRALSSWTGKTEVAFDLEAHGREDVLEGVDISRTVGWFTTLYPVIIHAPQADLAQHIKYVKEKLHAIPHKGFNYGVLKHLDGLDLAVDTGISFNYLGQISQDGLGDAFRLITPDVSTSIDARNLRPYLLDVICMVVDGRLGIEILFSRNKHLRESIASLAPSFKDELCGVIAHCLKPENFDITPSDFDLVEMDQKELDKLADFE